MTLLTLCPPLLLMSGCLAYVFWSRANLDAPRARTRIDYLRERLEVVYDNLRDLNFEFRAGKYPEADYATQREALESEAVVILKQIERLERTIKAAA